MGEQGDKIEISCRKNLIDTFKNLIKQGAFKEFRTFGVNENSGSARLRNDFRITLNYCSQISDSDESAIPEHGLNLVSFDDILSKKIPIVHYIDFIGEVTTYSPITINDNLRFMTLELIDLEHRTITYVIWGMYADQFTAYASINGEKGPIIIVVQLGQRISYQVEIRDFSEWILNIGDGEAGEPNDGEAGEPNDGEGCVEISDDILIDGGDDPIAAVVDNTYPDIEVHLWEATYFQERAILAPTHDIVETVNDHVLSQLPGEERTYLSFDAISKEETNFGVHEIYSNEFLNTIKCPGFSKS
ncbi:uncharacterized protein LOC125497902 [Beta vulgaris subsp. vulgaris]|uniref:uncharacterized protein LOC125497902 n=1 Tax=Beta vulgaris subsp. vulgaris TaxID=3555 RepID=UPI002037563F|nr:uncharacterized protein LOC125497902 [Beta vulgaris subsp. vulgaris]